MWGSRMNVLRGMRGWTARYAPSKPLLLVWLMLNRLGARYRILGPVHRHVGVGCTLQARTTSKDSTTTCHRTDLELGSRQQMHRSCSCSIFESPSVPLLSAAMAARPSVVGTACHDPRTIVFRTTIRPNLNLLQRAAFSSRAPRAHDRR